MVCLLRPIRSRRGASLIETLIYTALMVLILGVALLLFNYTRDISSQANKGFALGQDLDSPIHRLRHDLRETALQSVRFERVSGNPTLSMASARDKDENFTVNRFGAPDWNGWVVYTLRAAEAGMGQLVRYRVEPDKPGVYPVPWVSGPLRTTPRTITTQTLAPGYWALPDPQGQFRLEKDSGHPNGGFSVNFVRREGKMETLSPLNPNQNSDEDKPDWSAGSTTLLEVTLGLIETSGDGKLSMLVVPIRVRPRH